MAGKVFVVLPPTTKSDSVIYGRISFENCEEIVYFPSTAQPNTTIKLANLEVAGKDAYGIILSKSKEEWGGLSGSNEKNVTIGLVYKNNEKGILGNELLRLALERSTSAETAIEIINELVQELETDDVDGAPVFSFVICDERYVYVLNIVGKLWAAEKIEDQYKCIGSGFTIETKIDKHSENLKEKCKSLSLWDGTDEFNFRKVFNYNDEVSTSWYGKEPEGENTFTEETMFNVLRSFNDVDQAKSSHVSVLNPKSITVNWFTGTSTKESVFKPFVFTPGARISPLTKVKDGDEDTLLNTLHKNRKWEVVGSLLQSLEKTCVDEMNSFLSENLGTPNQELDDLMKDCVEAEVKFYR